MSVLTGNIKWIMLVSGLLTCTMFYAAVAPQASLRSMFDTGLEGNLAEIIVRNWGALIGLVGLLLIYGAAHPPVRSAALAVAAVSKSAFIALVLIYGREYLGHQAGVAVATDSVMVVIFAAYLVTVRPGDVSIG